MIPKMTKSYHFLSETHSSVSIPPCQTINMIFFTEAVGRCLDLIEQVYALDDTEDCGQ